MCGVKPTAFPCLKCHSVENNVVLVLSVGFRCVSIIKCSQFTSNCSTCAFQLRVDWLFFHSVTESKKLLEEILPVKYPMVLSPTEHH